MFELFDHIDGRSLEEITVELEQTHSLSTYTRNMDDGTILVTFNYNQIKTNFREPIGRQSRGVIFHYDPTTHSYVLVCRAFDKFFTWSDSSEQVINDQLSFHWPSCKFIEKLDGSLIKLYNFRGEWIYATNRSINASGPLRGNKVSYETFQQLIDNAMSDYDYDQLDTNNTYMFELVSPYNKVIVDYDEIEMYHIATRSLSDQQFIEVDIGIKKPIVYDFDSLNSAAESLNDKFNFEGYIAIDKHNNRIKVKSPTWVRMKHLTGQTKDSTFIGAILNGEQREIMDTIPEVIPRLNAIQEKFDRYVDLIWTAHQLASSNDSSGSSNKEYANILREVYDKTSVKIPKIHFVVKKDRLELKVRNDIIIWMRDNADPKKIESILSRV